MKQTAVRRLLVGAMSLQSALMNQADLSLLMRYLS